jgi:hypothetical protein
MKQPLPVNALARQREARRPCSMKMAAKRTPRHIRLLLGAVNLGEAQGSKKYRQKYRSARHYNYRRNSMKPSGYRAAMTEITRPAGSKEARKEAMRQIYGEKGKRSESEAEA